MTLHLAFVEPKRILAKDHFACPVRARCPECNRHVEVAAATFCAVAHDEAPAWKKPPYWRLELECEE